MGRYTGAKGRVNRRLGAVVFESAGAMRALERRKGPPGQVTNSRRRNKVSTFGAGLREKQKIKYYYGLSERQLRRYYELAGRRVGNTGEELLMMCERRLDNVVRRSGLARTRTQARQGIVHCHFLVNGVKTNKPSFLVRPGDTIEVRDRTNLQNVYREIVDSQGAEPMAWVTTEEDKLRATVTGYPGPSDISLPVEVGTVIEFMSR